MPGLYGVVLNRDIRAINGMLEPLNKALEELGDNIPTMINEPLAGDSIAPDHIGLRIGDLAHLLAFHDVCYFLVTEQGDILSCVVGEVEEIA